ncbi:MAG TPA: carbon-nitrogen hydrolase family protein [Kofleriaceae bacterium]|nr:carbon-nitrogen hydrolase family protein [Kofleriaceae bacterium]
MKLTVATCQFPISADIRSNLRFVLAQMREARARRAHVAHFPEACLSGYAGIDFESHAGFDWRLLEDSARQVLERAKSLGLWVVLGSAHRLTARHKPHNSLYIIDSNGRIADRYDKRFCSGDRGGKTGDLAHYSPGNHLSVFTINGVRCGALICYDFRYPELYRAYRRERVQLLFHSFHAGGLSASRYLEMKRYVSARFAKLSGGATIPAVTMPATVQAAAASNYMWISCPNSSAPESCWPGFMVRPDGVVVGRLERNKHDILLTTVDTSEELYDSTAAWRGRAMSGVLHSGALVRDPRSSRRKRL